MDHISKHLRPPADASAAPTTSELQRAPAKDSTGSSAISPTWQKDDRDRAERLLASLREPTQPGAMPSSRGVLLSAVTPGERMSTDDASYFAGRCTSAYGYDFTEAETLFNARVWDVWEQCQRDGWTSETFRRAVDRFVVAEKFATWAPADFFAKAGAPKIYGHVWYAEQVAAGRGAEVGRYVTTTPSGAEQVVWGWRIECDGLLPEHVFTPDAQRSEAPTEPSEESGAGIPASARPQWDAMKEVLNLKGEIDALKAELAGVRRELALERETSARLRRTSEELQLQLSSIIERNAEREERA